MQPRIDEPDWQRRWAEAGVFRAAASGDDAPPYYCLEMLPYPSGRLHMGHVRNYTIGDAVARFRRMRGFRVMHVIGWDAFGLPAENAAIQNREDPGRWTRRNIAAMRQQLQRLGFGYDWSREIATCEPEYYRWNQWFFLRMLERGLAYRARRALNWCGSCATVLANEQVTGGRCWRCDQPVHRREFDQWFLRITRYAQELYEELERLVGWPEKVRTMQRHWIGQSAGARVRFEVAGGGPALDVFTTRIDTIFGATYLALAAEHPALEELVRDRPEGRAVREFVAELAAQTVEQRFAEGVQKRGLFTGRYAVHPFSGARLPIWVANFVLHDVGTGAVMSVPAHDARDFEFARLHGLPVRPVIRPAGGPLPAAESLGEATTEDGVLENSGPYDGLTSVEARARMGADAQARGFGGPEVTYRLKDWGVSRQRYWGTPIPVVHCARCGIVGVPEDELPVLLPENPPLTGEGGSPLAQLRGFVETRCPRCGEAARRETDTMDTFVDSSWYFFRYLDPHNDERPFDPALAHAWTPVDLYIGGIEHATLHLIYTRFWTKMMRDLGLVDAGEPVTELFTQGMVIKDGAKMSKSKGNVVDPDLMIERYGADTTRLFCLFAAPPEKDLEWSEAGVEGCQRFLARVRRVYERARPHLAPVATAPPDAAASGDALALRRKTQRTIARVTSDLGGRMRLNTAVAAIMELINSATTLAEREAPSAAEGWALREAFDALARMLVPFAPHFAEELWHDLGGSGFAALASWPEPDPALLEDEVVTVVVQVAGKTRGKVMLARGSAEEEALAAARAEPRVAAHIAGKALRRVVWVPDRLLNLVPA